MTYNVFGGMLSLTQSINHIFCVFSRLYGSLCGVRSSRCFVPKTSFLFSAVIPSNKDFSLSVHQLVL